MQIKDLAREQILTEIISERDAMILEQHRQIQTLQDQIKNLQEELNKLKKEKPSEEVT